MDMSHDHAPAPEMEMEMTSMPTTMMQMAFYWGKDTTILFTSWKTTSVGIYLLSLLALFIISFFYQYLERLTSSSSPLLCCPPAPQPKFAAEDQRPQGKNSLPLSRKLLLTAIFCVRVGLAYLLMLAVMSFNGGVFLAVILGFSAGFFVFRTDIFASTRTFNLPSDVGLRSSA